MKPSHTMVRFLLYTSLKVYQSTKKEICFLNGQWQMYKLFIK